MVDTNSRNLLCLSLTVLLGFMPVAATPALAKVSKPQAEPIPIKKVDDPGCTTCISNAASLFARGQVSEARALLTEWSPKCPSNSQLHSLFATVLLSMGANADAEREASLATQLSPSSLAARLQRGMALVALDKKLQAVSEFEHAAEIDPACYEAWVALSSLYRQLHEDEKALDATAKAADLEPATKSQRMSTLSNLKRAGKFAEARSEIKRMLVSSTTSPEFAEELARESLLVGGFDEAVEAAGKALAAHPKAVAPLMTSALAHYCQSNYSACIDDSTKVTEIDPQNNDSQSMRALALVKSNQLDDAEKALKGLNANSTLYLLSKGTLDFARNNLLGAEEALQSCLSYDQGNNNMQGIPHVLARITLAEIYKAQGKRALVAEQLQALSREKRFPQAITELQR